MNFYPFADGTGTPVMSIGQANVGIGTTAPEEQLHISNAGGTAILIEADTGNVNESDNPSIHFRQDGGAVTGIMGFEGNAGNLFTNTLENTLFLGTNTNYPLQFMTNSNVRMTIEQGGDVGIGITNPSEKLDVSGNVEITGDYQYATAQTRRLTVHNSSFNPFEGGGNTSYQRAGVGRRLGVDNSGTLGVDIEFVAQVYLPDGAIVTELTGYFYDFQAAYEATVTLYRATKGGGGGSSMAVSSSGVAFSSGVTNDPVTTITSATIDNTSYFYWLVFKTEEASNNTLDLYGVDIDYTITKLD